MIDSILHISLPCINSNIDSKINLSKLKDSKKRVNSCIYDMKKVCESPPECSIIEII